MSTRGNWNEVRESFDRRKKARANDVAQEPSEGKDMFFKAGAVE